VPLPAYFAENFNPNARKFASLGRFEVESSQIQVYRKLILKLSFFENLILRLLNYKTSYKSELLVDRVQIFGKRCGMVPKTRKKLFRIMPGFWQWHHVYYNTWRWIFKSTFIRATRQMTRLCDFRKNDYFRTNLDLFRINFWHNVFVVHYLPCPEKFCFPTYASVLLIASHLFIYYDI